MVYCVTLDMTTRFGTTEMIELTTPTGSAVDETVMGQAIADAEAEINGYLIGKYTLPLASPPNALKLISCDIARQKLYRRVEPPERVKDAYKAAIKYLEQVAKGVLNLGIGSAQTVVEQAVSVQYSDGTTRVLDRDSLTGW